MDIRHFLDDLEIDEPSGFADLELSMKRDDKYHGMQFEASTSSLVFYGEAASYLQSAKQLNGIRANVIYRVEISCDNNEYDEIYRGRLNFGKYKESCGTSCRVSMPAEEDSCRVIFKSRFDQKVDMDSNIAFDQVTGLPGYAALGIDMEIPAKALEVAVVASVIEDGNEIIVEDLLIPGVRKWIGRPSYLAIEYNSIATGQPDAVSNYELQSDPFAIPISPQLLFEDIITCFNGQFEYEFNFEGTILIQRTGGSISLTGSKLKVVLWDAVGNIFDDSTLVEEIDLGISESNFVTINEAFTNKLLSGTVNIPEGYGFYAFLELSFDPVIFAEIDITITFSDHTSMNIRAVKLCPATNAQVYMIHEALSRVTEAITNRCIRAKSDYYGRIDSQPFAADIDGCGGLRLLTNGLKLRQAVEGQDKFFASAKDIIEGLWGIDNIGFGIEDDPDIPHHYVLRVESVDHFYQDTELLVLDAVPKADVDVQETLHYSKVLIGYKKWEVEEVNGLGEPNSNREYRTSLDTISNPLDATSALVTGSYPIEITRQQSFAESGAADTTYDNDIFLITVLRNAYDFEVEQGGITNPSNIFDPDSLFNYRLTPARNMLRWAKSVFNSYSSFTSSSAKIFFSSGTGNISASGEIADSTCKLESGVLSESQDISQNTFANQEDYTPLWRPEYMTFDYPLSVAQYQELKANPYGYLSVQCGVGEYEKAFIQEIKFQLAKGKATFILKKKW